MTLRLPRRRRGDGSRVHPGQAIVEFAFASIIFLLIVFGTIDFGRAIFIAGDLHNAAREGARYGKVHRIASGRPAADKGRNRRQYRVACGNVVRAGFPVRLVDPDALCLSCWTESQLDRAGVER